LPSHERQLGDRDLIAAAKHSISDVSSNGPASNRTIAAALIRMGCNQNYRHAMTLRPQRLLQFKAT
jgi:hypothetical protein